MYHSIISPDKDNTIEQGPPLTAKTAAERFMRNDGYVVGYQTLTESASVAFLTRLTRGGVPEYGFVYLSAPNRPPVFVAATARGSITAAMSARNKRVGRTMVAASSLVEFLIALEIA